MVGVNRRPRQGHQKPSSGLPHALPIAVPHLAPAAPCRDGRGHPRAACIVEGWRGRVWGHPRFDVGAGDPQGGNAGFANLVYMTRIFWAKLRDQSHTVAGTFRHQNGG